MKKLFFLFLFFSVHHLYGQLILSNNPPGVNWQQINTPYFRVLFPQGFEREAQRIASTFEFIREAESATLGSKPRKISVILQNRSSISNGFVSILPRRSELYTMPAQDYNFIGTNDWLTLLASHEYRHVVQYQHATRGFNRLFYYLFGNPTLAGMSQAAAPQWFWEGDAVATETGFTHSGRGRIPNFGLLFRTNLLEGRKFNYHKQYLRSYKHNIPDHYVLGYHMVSYLRRKTNDPAIWGKITARSWSVPFIPFAFSNAIKNKTGLYVTDLYREMAGTLQQEWQEDVNKLILTPFEKVNRRSTNAYTDYLYPQPQEDGSVIVMKKGIGDIEQFVRLTDGEEEKIFVPGFINDAGMLSAEKNIIVWNEYGYHPRWRVKNYSLIKAFDALQRDKITVSDNQGRYGSATLSPDGKQIVTVASTTSYDHKLLILTYPEGQLVKEFSNASNDFFSMPRWSSDGKKIVVLKTTSKGKTVTTFDVQTGDAEDLLPVSNENIGHPVLHGKFLLFNSPVSGIDNIYALDLQTQQRYQVTTSKYGAYNPAISKGGDIIYYNEQVRNGMDVVKIPFDASAWKTYVEKKETRSFYQLLMEQEGRPNLFDSIPQQKHPVSRYSKISGIINPYSWGAYVDTNLSTADFGITSRDILSTTNITAGYAFDINERTGFWRAGISYQGWFPIIDLNFTQGKRSVDEGSARTIIINGNDTTSVVNDIEFEWDEQNIEGGVRIPLLLSRSKYASNITIGNAVGVTKVTDFRNENSSERYVPAIIRNDTILSVYPFFDYIGNGTLVYNRFNLSASRLLKVSRRDINSRWGQAISLNYYNTPYGGDLEGGLWSFTGYLYFPGIAKHHSLHGYWAYQSTDVSTNLNEALDDYIFRNTVPVPRGHDVNRFRKFYSMAVNYTLPLWYPDIALGPILNIQRVRANLFLDHAYGQQMLFSGIDDSYTSVGGEMKFDINIMRFLPQFDIGFRFSYGLSPSVQKFEFLIGTFNF